VRIVSADRFSLVFFKAIQVQIAPAKSAAPIAIRIGEVYFNRAKTVKDKKTSILVGMVNLKKE